MKTTCDFELYRYQLLPIDRHLQGDLLSGVTSVAELLEMKNEIFSDGLQQVDDFSSGTTQTVTKRLFSEGEFFLYRIAANRSIHRETREFTEEIIDNWPSLYVGIWNDPGVQLVAIQKRSTAFQHTETVLNLVIGAVEKSLAHHQLRMHAEPLFETHEFWKIMKEHKGRVQKLDFEFITPNMANISNTLSDDLRNFTKRTNSAKNELSIQSDPEASLKVDEDDADINGLVEYSAAGGGNISVRLAGMRKTIETSKTKKKIYIEEAILEGESEEVVEILKELMR